MFFFRIKSRQSLNIGLIKLAALLIQYFPLDTSNKHTEKNQNNKNYPDSANMPNFVGGNSRLFAKHTKNSN